MAIDIFDIEPNKVSRDLSGYITYIFGEGGTGKTTLAAQLEKPLLLAFEPGYRALPGVRAIDVTSWADFKSVVRQLKNPKAKETFKSISIDTVDIAADLCEKYICSNNDVEKLSDIPWGNGFKLMKKEFEESFRTIAQLGYAVFFISHAKDKTIKREDGTEYTRVIPSLTPSYNEIIRNMADIEAYAHQVSIENGMPQVMLTLRSMDGSIECKSRFKYIEPEIPFTYDALSKALTDAIDTEAKKNENKYVTDKRATIAAPDLPEFDNVMTEFNDIVTKLQKTSGKEFATKWAPKISETVAKYLGRNKRVAECTPAQAETVQAIVDDLKDQIGNGI